MDKVISIIDMRINKLQDDYNKIYKTKNTNSIEMNMNITHLRCLSRAINELKVVKHMILQGNEQ